MTRRLTAGRRSRLATFGAITVVATLFLTACGGGDGAGGKSADDGIVVIGDPAEAVSLDPADDTSVSGYARKYLFYETLLERTESGEMKPVLATEWKQLDKRTYEFTLRPGVTFHDGAKLTAEDVVFSIERLIKGDYQDTVNTEPYFASAEAVDDLTVKVSSIDPLGTFLPRVAGIRIVPKHVVEKVGDQQFARNPVGTGPFTFTSWTRDSELRATAFAGYWGQKPVAKGITYRVLPEASARMSALTSGEIDVALNLPKETTAQLESADCCKVATTPTNRVFFIGMNTNQEPLNKPKVRQALNYAIDKETLSRTIMSGNVKLHGDGKSLMFGESITGFDPDVTGYPYDPEKAKALLAEAGYPNGIDITFAGPRARYPNDAALVEAMAEMLKKAGVNAKVDLTEWNTYWPKTQAGDQPGLWVLSLGNSVWDAEYYLTTYLSSLGRGYFSTPETDAEIKAQRAETDPEARTERLRKITKELVEQQAPWIFLWDMVDLHGVSASVQGFKVGLDQRIDEKTISVSGS
ncbi:ABC transporter substrate-binding protein [Nonomuraea sp. NPDC004297]